MNLGKAYAVLLADGAADELGRTFGLFIKNKDDDFYINAKAIEPEGNYFQLTVEQEILVGEKMELDIQIPHELVKGTFCGSEKDVRELGFA